MMHVACCVLYSTATLVDVEALVGEASVGALREFLALLTASIKRRVGAQALVIYYDSLNEAGQIQYQNALTAANASYFDASDGIFTNYWWRPEHLASSATLALDRRCDVYCGVDVFARRTAYTAGPGCAPACRMVRDARLSLALFAPGWSLECGGACDEASDRSFWEQIGVGPGWAACADTDTAGAAGEGGAADAALAEDGALCC